MIPSFFFIFWFSDIRISIISTFLKSPILGTTKSTILAILNYSFVGIGFLGSMLYFFIASVATFDAIFCSFTKVLNVE